VATFEISVKSPVTLDERRTGTAVFTVRNTSVRPLAAVARIRVETGTDPSWVAIAGDARHTYPASAEADVTVTVTVPMTVPAGAYRFHIEVLGEELPEEDQGRSPDEEIRVGALSAGYVVTFVGAAAGGGLGLAIGLLPVLIALIVLINTPLKPTNGGIGEVIGQIIGAAVVLILVAALLIVIGVFVGLWIGPVIGSFIALRLRRQDAVGLTAGLIAVIQPLWSIAMAVVVGQLERINNSPPFQFVLLVVFGIVAVAAPPWPARWLALRLHPRPGGGKKQ
jgi:hypothetical protein